MQEAGYVFRGNGIINVSFICIFIEAMLAGTKKKIGQLVGSGTVIFNDSRNDE